MKYCTNCSEKLSKDGKFCTSCGHPVNHNKLEKITIEESTKAPKEKLINNNISEIQTTGNNRMLNKKTYNKWMLFYFLVHIPLYIANTGSGENVGIIIISVMVIIDFFSFSFTKGKEKPYTIFLKFILVIQSLLAVSGIVKRLENIESEYSLIAVISYVFMVFLNILFVFKRNK